MTRNIIFKDGRIVKESLVTDRYDARELINNLPAPDEE